MIHFREDFLEIFTVYYNAKYIRGVPLSRLQTMLGCG